MFILVRYLVCPWHLLIEQLDGMKNILDVGCGHGLFLCLAQQRFPALRCCGFDHDEKKIRLARQARPHADINFSSDPDGLISWQEKFDCISFIDVLYSIPPAQWIEILQQFRRYLKPGGTLIVKETVNHPPWKFRLCMAQEKMALQILRYTKGDAPTLPSPGVYTSALKAAGFIVLNRQRLDKGYPWPHYLVVGKSMTD
ncbi:MAG: class I SAM-dependent methyltransferase [Desulfobacteraceae bacterium]|nr:class I SAM-dependent methyltransferase [Desulfobacteraceae bacterium]